jgi:hypothetical protein
VAWMKTQTVTPMSHGAAHGTDEDANGDIGAARGAGWSTGATSGVGVDVSTTRGTG